MKIRPVSICGRPAAVQQLTTLFERLPEPCKLVCLEIDAAPRTIRVNRVYFCSRTHAGEAHCIEVVTKFPYDASKLLVVNVPKPVDTWLAVDFTVLGNPCIIPMFDGTAWVETP